MTDLGIEVPELPLCPGELRFFVPGIPKPGGSKRFLGMSRRGKAILTDASGQAGKNWRAMVAAVAFANKPKELLTGPLEVSFQFHMPRPKHHFHTSKKKRGLLRDDAPFFHTIKPDALKLARSTEDAMTKIIWADDAQTCRIQSAKMYGSPVGCAVFIVPLDGPGT